MNTLFIVTRLNFGGYNVIMIKLAVGIRRANCSQFAIYDLDTRPAFPPKAPTKRIIMTNVIVVSPINTGRSIINCVPTRACCQFPFSNNSPVSCRFASVCPLCFPSLSLLLTIPSSEGGNNFLAPHWRTLWGNVTLKQYLCVSGFIVSPWEWEDDLFSQLFCKWCEYYLWPVIDGRGWWN